MESVKTQVKKNRSTNWTEKEKRVLQMLISERTDVIEKKDTSSNTNMAKKVAWGEVLSRFNAMNEVKRDMQQILNQWRNMKHRAKKVKPAHRTAWVKTGGGSPPLSPSLEDGESMEAVSHVFQIVSNCYGSDSDYSNQEQRTFVKASPPTIEENTDSSSTQLHFCNMEQGTWELSSPPPIKEESPGSTSTPEPTNNKRDIQKQKNKICKGKCCGEDHEHQIFLLQSKYREEIMRREKEAHECKMKYERETHERRMAIMSLEEEYWRKKINQLGT